MTTKSENKGGRESDTSRDGRNQQGSVSRDGNGTKTTLGTSLQSRSGENETISSSSGGTGDLPDNRLGIICHKVTGIRLLQFRRLWI